MSTPPGARIDRWARIMASAWRHEKFLGLDADPLALWGMALSWSMDHGTDGRIPEAAIRQILPALTPGRATRATGALVERRLWEQVTGGFQIHDWTYYNPTVADLDSLRTVRAEVGKRGASARWASDGKSHSGNDGKSHSKSHSKPHGKPMAEVEEEEEVEKYNGRPGKPDDRATSSTSSVDAERKWSDTVTDTPAGQTLQVFEAYKQGYRDLYHKDPAPIERKDMPHLCRVLKHYGLPKVLEFVTCFFEAREKFTGDFFAERGHALNIFYSSIPTLVAIRAGKVK